MVVLVISLAPLLTVATGCGSSDETAEDEEAITAVIERFHRAISEGDAATVCRTLLAPDSGIAPSRCERGFSDRDPGADELEIESITINGDSARVSYAEGQGFTELVHVDDGWYIDPAG